VKLSIQSLSDKHELALNFIAMSEVVDQGDKAGIEALVKQVPDMKDCFTDHLDAAKLMMTKMKSYLNSL
jgi:hypothetical protein